MSMTERAAQFGAFRALTGYEDEIAETARCTDAKIEPDEYAKAEINAKLQYINDQSDQFTDRILKTRRVNYIPAIKIHLRLPRKRI